MTSSQRISVLSFSLFAIIFAFFVFALSAHAATVTVNSTNADADAMDGQCNLEEAINAINGQSNSGDCFANLDNPYGTDDTILFDINGGGPVTITGSTSPLTISNPVIIDGLWQDDLATCGTEDHMGDRALYVTLDGFVLQVYSDDVTIYGLVFAHDVDALVFNEGQGHHVFCNNFGFDGSGQDTLGPTGSKLRIHAVDGIEVGYTNDRKLGNMFAGSVDDNATETLAVKNSSNVTIHGNRFGVGGGENPDVLGAVGSHIDFDIYDSEPWFIARNGENILIQNNYLYDSGGEASAITIRIGEEEGFGIDDVQILDNTISFSEIILDTNGIEVQNNITNLVIDGNIIQNFDHDGIRLRQNQGVVITNNTIESSSEDGIGIILGSVRDVIVGTPGNGNTVDVSSAAVELTPRGGDSVTDHVIIQGNTFTSIDAAAVQATFSAENVLIGGTQPGEGNNLLGRAGVVIFYTSAAEEYDPMLTVDNIAILGNTIDAEAGIAWLIDTDGDFTPEYAEGLISNDTLDTLSVLGPNRLIHSPEIINTTDNGDSTFTIEYEINVAAGEYRMEWYRDAEASDVDAGIGNEFLDSVDITHAGNGPETFTVTLPVALDDILAVTLTEIIAPGTNDWNFGATSQFSEQFVVVITEGETSGGISIPPTPTCSISATPLVIKKGESSLLRAMLQHQGIAAFFYSRFEHTPDIYGSDVFETTVSPLQTTEYILSVINPRGSNQCKVTVVVEDTVMVTSEETATPPTPPVSPSQDESSVDKILSSGACPKELILTDNLKQGDRNGRYGSYNKKVVTQVSTLQAHLNRILASKYNQAAGPVDGIFGPKTRRGVERLQQALNETLIPSPKLVLDGIVGPYTRNAINNSCGIVE